MLDSLNISSVSCVRSLDHAGIRIFIRFQNRPPVGLRLLRRQLGEPLNLTVLRWLERVKGGTWYKKYTNNPYREKLVNIWNITDENVRIMLRWGRTLSNELQSVIKFNFEYEKSNIVSFINPFMSFILLYYIWSHIYKTLFCLWYSIACRKMKGKITVSDAVQVTLNICSSVDFTVAW